jgi:hypothetical protein
VQNKHAWVPAGDLQPGDQVRDADGTVHKVVEVDAWTELQRVHNLTVDGIHTYYVVAGGSTILVHNCGPGGPSHNPATTFNVPQVPGVYTIHLSTGQKYVGMSTTNINTRVAASAQPGHAVDAAGLCACNIVNVTWMELPQGVTSVTARRVEQTVMEGYMSMGIGLINRRNPEFPLWFHKGISWSGFN